MTKIINAKFKVSRRLGTSIWGSGKDPVHKRNYRPGQQGASNTMAKSSDHGIHLNAKQRLKAHYGRVNERQFRNIFDEATRMHGNTGENFVGLLERRLDAVIYRLTIGRTIFTARQLVSHGHVKVNGKRVNIPSYRVKIGDVVEIKESSKNLPVIAEALAVGERRAPDYLIFDADRLSAKLTRVPSVTDIPYPFDPQINLIIEFYSK